MRPMALLSSIWLAGCSVFGINGVEEPRYTVAARVGHVEIRAYAPRVAAETEVAGGELAARSAGFRRLAGYIFGANHTRAKIAMTAPVAQSGGGQNIAMTAPVAQAAVPSGGGWRIRFFMPASYTLATLPVPDDPAVHLVVVPAETFAVLRFSGVPSPGAVARRQAALLAALRGSRWTPAAAPVAWFYDPPWTLPPLRRNEAAVAVQQK